jgi:SAM-dependent methyltransferase
MTTRDDIRGAYRYFLGREPETEAVLDKHVRDMPDFATLRARFLASPEFYRNNSREILRYLTVQQTKRRHGHIECECSPDNLKKLFAHIQGVWSRLGEVEPHFSVLSQPNYKPEKLNAHLTAFFATGKGEVELLQTELAGLGLKSKGFRHAVELGTGVGRVTRYLAGISERLTGYDVSAPHLRLAKDYLSNSGVNNAALEQIKDLAKFRFPECDFFYSRIVLQHNPPPIIVFLLREALMSLRPGVVAVFQLPTYIEGYSFSLNRYLDHMAEIDNQEIHAVPQNVVFRMIMESGCDLYSLIRDNSLSRITKVSNRFVVSKR